MLKIYVFIYANFVGTANSNLSVPEAAEQMCKAVHNFNSKSLKFVKEVHVVIFQQTMMSDYIDAIKKCASTMTDQGTFGKFVNWATGGRLSGNLCLLV